MILNLYRNARKRATMTIQGRGGIICRCALYLATQGTQRRFKGAYMKKKDDANDLLSNFQPDNPKRQARARRVVYFVSNFIYLLESRAVLNDRQQHIFNALDLFTRGASIDSIRAEFQQAKESNDDDDIAADSNRG